MAVKQLRVDKPSSSSDSGYRRALSFLKEMQLMMDLKHTNVVEFLGGCLQNGQVSMVFELCTASLHELLHQSTILHQSLCIPVAVQLKWAREIAAGVRYLHERDPPVVHRDLKPGNVLLTYEWIAKISDFGSARTKVDQVIQTAHIGTCQWTAPEVLRQQAHDERADSYSFAVLMYGVASRKMPYEGMSLQQV